MNEKEKILDLLDKKSLCEEEKILLNNLIRNDPEAGKIYEVYQKLKSAINKSDHISYNDLADFILLKNNAEPGNKNLIARVPEIELHLKVCERCLNEFRTLNAEYTEIESSVSKELSGLPGAENNSYMNDALKRKRFPVFALASVIIIAIVYSILLISGITSTENYELAAVGDKSEYYITRGRATDDFQESIKALEEGDFEKAVNALQTDINKNPSDETIFYSHYILGLAYLEKAEQSFLGLFNSFNKDDAQEGLKNLMLCIDKNKSGKFPDITYNAYFYSAKANIMLGNIETAKEYLNYVIANKGGKMSEARNLLNELE